MMYVYASIVKYSDVRNQSKPKMFFFSDKKKKEKSMCGGVGILKFLQPKSNKPAHPFKCQLNFTTLSSPYTLL